MRRMRFVMEGREDLQVKNDDYLIIRWLLACAQIIYSGKSFFLSGPKGK
jgi:hypothetical protein